jgi:hypothetical protein
MNQAEIASEIANLKRWEATPGLPDTFMERVPHDEKNTIRYIRAVADDTALATSTRNAADAEAFAHAERMLSFGTSQLSRLLANQVTKITPFESGIAEFDSFLALAPRVAQFLTENNPFGMRLMDQTTTCYAINHIEFAGSETEQEALARKKKVSLVDLKREITPVIFARYHKESGQRSHKHLAIATYAETKRVIEQLQEDGGLVELENWERVRLTFTTEPTKGKAKPKVEATFMKETKPIAIDAAVELMTVLTTKDAKAAEKKWK